MPSTASTWTKCFGRLTAIISAVALLSVPATQAQEYEYEPDEGLHEEEWYDPSDWFDRDLMEDRFAALEPLWPLGEGTGYHPISFGVPADDVVQTRHASLAVVWMSLSRVTLRRTSSDGSPKSMMQATSSTPSS